MSLADINLNSPNKGLLPDAMMDVPVDAAGATQTPAAEGLTEAEEEELRAELSKVLCLGWGAWGDRESRPSQADKGPWLVWLCRMWRPSLQPRRNGSLQP